jgi:hypothetical protein
MSHRNSRDWPSSRENFWAAVKGNGFVLGMLLAVILAFLFPTPGAKGELLHADILNNAGVALILFVQGLAMAVERMKSGLRNWPLHLMIQRIYISGFPGDWPGLARSQPDTLAGRACRPSGGFPVSLCFALHGFDVCRPDERCQGEHLSRYLQRRTIEYHGRRSDSGPGSSLDAGKRPDWTARA